MEYLAQVYLDRAPDVPPSVVSSNVIVLLGDMGQNQLLSRVEEGLSTAMDICVAIHLRRAGLGKEKEGLGVLG